MKELNDIVDDFQLLGDWESRYQYLVELGEQLPAMAAADKTEQHRVKACMSQVWVRAVADPDNPDRIRFVGDCDTAIIKGVLALLIELASERTAPEIQQLDVDALFHHLALDENLSPNRHVGVYAIVDLMKQQAQEFAREPQLAAHA